MTKVYNVPKNQNQISKGIVIGGPTAVGKTSLSVKLAKEIDSEIISADSTQLYRELDIITAKVTKNEMGGIIHHMIDVVDIGEEYTVGNYEKDVNKILNNQQGKNIILVGGTGLYLKSITDGFGLMPEKDEKLREKLEKKTLKELKEQIKKLDYQSFIEIDLHNKVRLVRAIEVCLLTGKKFSDLKKENIKDNNYSFYKYYLTRDREELYNLINKRVDIMLENGMIEEARKIYDKYPEEVRNSISAIGYRDIFSYFQNKISFDDAINKIKQDSRRYAKRQLTWFRQDKSYKEINVSRLNEKEIIDLILNETMIE